MRFGKEWPKAAKRIQIIRNARASGSNPVCDSIKLAGFRDFRNPFLLLTFKTVRLEHAFS